MIQTERLQVRPWIEDDAQAFFDLTQDPGFNLYPITVYTQPDLESAHRWICSAMALYKAEGVYLLPVFLRSTKELIGIAGLRLTRVPQETRFELTYRLRESAWGQGYATEVARAWIDYGFTQLGLSEIAASITPDNEPSLKLARKLGMRKTGDEIMKGVPAEIWRLGAQQR
jgi:RimJ/RimL family protein N-acetyltransferase